MSTTPPPEDPTPPPEDTEQPPEDPEQQNWWQRRGKGGKAAVVLGALFAVLIVIGAIASPSEETTTDQTGGSAAREAPPEPKELTIERVNEAGQTFAKSSVEITGIVSEPGATVTVRGSKSDTTSPTGRFSLRVRLSEIGKNEIELTANKPGFKSDTMEFGITRERTAAEKAALEERQRQREEQELAELRASAQELDPKQLQKDPDRYIGETVVMTGEIFQIQEGGDNFFLMNTECETEFDITICDGPTVHVTYDMSTDKTEEDIVTVYGTVTGGFEYETQIGGSNYVGSIEAEIIE